jgi:hypothetical protein
MISTPIRVVRVAGGERWAVRWGDKLVALYVTRAGAERRAERERKRYRLDVARSRR